MSFLLEYKIQRFLSNSDTNLLNEAYLLNQSNTPEVGSLNSVDDLAKLLKMSEDSFVVTFDHLLIGFIVCLREGSAYKSSNYKYFSQRLDKFLYIDRIAIKNDMRRKGIGEEVYSHIQKTADLNKIPLCCEINTIPLNRPSIQFHTKLGFEEVGHKSFNDHTVAYFIKKNK